MMDDLQTIQSPQILANIVCMLRSASPGAVWLAPNANASRLLKPLIAKEARVILAERMTEAVLEILSARRCNGVLTIVDLEPGATYPLPPRFAPDEGDLDCLLIGSGAMERVLAQLDQVHDTATAAQELRAELASALRGAQQCADTSWHEGVRGVDCISLLEQRFGQGVRRDLQLAFPHSDFVRTTLYLRILHWEICEGVKALRELRDRDPLGTLLDQRYWERDLDHFLSVDVPTAVVKLDLDHFKTVNDLLGHGAGDKALRRYCEVVREVVGRKGLVYRRGGDEVLAIVPAVTLNEATAMAEVVRAQIATQLEGLSAGSPITASIGLVHVSTKRDYGGVTQILDDAQKLSKDNGRNRVEAIAYQ